MRIPNSVGDLSLEEVFILLERLAGRINREDLVYARYEYLKRAGIALMDTGIQEMHLSRIRRELQEYQNGWLQVQEGRRLLDRAVEIWTEGMRGPQHNPSVDADAEADPRR